MRMMRVTNTREQIVWINPMRVDTIELAGNGCIVNIHCGDPINTRASTEEMAREWSRATYESHDTLSACEEAAHAD
jgi:hypothetical protein